MQPIPFLSLVLIVPYHMCQWQPPHSLKNFHLFILLILPSHYAHILQATILSNVVGMGPHFSSSNEFHHYYFQPPITVYSPPNFILQNNITFQEFVIYCYPTNHHTQCLKIAFIYFCLFVCELVGGQLISAGLS